MASSYRIILVNNLKLYITSKVYEPAEDTFLLLNMANKIISCKNKEKVLEIGCGSGIIAISIAKKGCDVVATDISPYAVELTKLNAELNNVKLDIKQGDLFAPVGNDLFDYVLFNPPYLPEDPLDVLIDKHFLTAVVGGKKGNETLKRFLLELPNHLKPNGLALITISSLSSPQEIFKLCENLNLKCKKIASHKFFFEEIYVLEITTRNNQK